MLIIFFLTEGKEIEDKYAVKTSASLIQSNWEWLKQRFDLLRVIKALSLVIPVWPMRICSSQLTKKHLLFVES